MSMPIQRQSEAFGIFDDGPRYARDRASTDLPRGLAGLVNSSGPRIQAGLLNTRQASCEYCGEPGHDWQIHPEAHRDIADWKKERHLQEFPFGDYTEGVYPSEDDHGGEAWPGHFGSHTAGWHTPDYDPRVDGYAKDYGDRPSASELAEMEADREEERRQRPYLRKLDEQDPSQFIPGDFVDPREARRGSGRHPFDRAARRRLAEHDDLPPLPDDFHIPDSPEGQPDRSPGWLYRQFVGPHKGVWDIPEHELDERWNKVYDTLGFSPEIREQWEAARNSGDPSDRWDGGMDGTLGGGVKDYLTRAPMSKEEYARHREDSRNRAKALADGLWNAIYPPEEEEGRRSVQNMDTVNSLMANGWQPEHIKYDEDDQPYALYQHPSGWTVKDHGGMYKDIGHVATPGEAHDVINVDRYDPSSGESWHAPFGPQDAHDYIEEQLHGDPEETGGTFQHLTENHPAIRRYKPRQAARLANDIGPRFAQYSPTPWEKTNEGWHNPGSGSRIVPSDDGRWKLMAPSKTVKSSDAPRYAPLATHDDPQVLMEHHDWISGGPPPDWHGRPRWWHRMFPPAPPRHAAQMSHEDATNYVTHGFQPAHRVGLDWRDRTVPGTVIGVDPDRIHVRWDDGQYTSEDPNEVHLL